MPDSACFPQDVADAQVRMFAMFVGPGRWCPRTALAAASGVPESTLKSYAEGAEPFMSYAECQWAFVGHQPQCRFAAIRGGRHDHC